MRVLVAGGGIGGMLAARLLAREGVDVTVFERAAKVEHSQLGGGMGLAYNATRVLRHAGVLDEVEAAGTRLQHFAFRTWRGESLVEWDMLPNELQLGVGRASLHAVLRDALPEGTLRMGMKCTGFEQDASGVTARFADGAEERGDVLVGADGLESVVRAQLLGSEPPRYAGYAVWRAITETAEDLVPPDEWLMQWGRGRRFAVYRVAPGSLYWFAVDNAPEGGRDPETGAKASLLERFGDWAAPAPAVIQATPEPLIRRTDIYDRPPVGRWGEGRVTLLGDAAHPMTFNLGQGACQAMESALVLSRRLAGAPDPVGALRSYEAERQKRTASMTLLSRRIGAMGRVKNPVGVAMREQFMKRVFGRVALPKQEQDLLIDV